MDFAQMRDQLAEEVLNPAAVPVPVSAKKVKKAEQKKEMETPMKPAREVSEKVNPLNTDSNRPQDREHRRNPNVYGDRPVTAFDSGNMKYSLWDYMKPEKVSTENFPEGGNPEIDTESYIAGLIGMVGTGVLGGILGGIGGVALGGMAGKYLTEPAVHYLTQDQEPANENVPVSAKQKTQPKTQPKTESSEVKYTNRDRFGNESAGSGPTTGSRGRTRTSSSSNNSSNSNTDRDRQSQENPNVRATNNPSSLPSDHAGRPR